MHKHFLSFCCTIKSGYTFINMASSAGPSGAFMRYFHTSCSVYHFPLESFISFWYTVAIVLGSKSNSMAKLASLLEWTTLTSPYILMRSCRVKLSSSSGVTSNPNYFSCSNDIHSLLSPTSSRKKGAVLPSQSISINRLFSNTLLLAFSKNSISIFCTPSA